MLPKVDIIAIITYHYHFITLDSKEDAMEFNVRVKEVYITPAEVAGAFELFAELTSIPTGEMFNLSGSGITNAVDR